MPCAIEKRKHRCGYRRYFHVRQALNSKTLAFSLSFALPLFFRRRIMTSRSKWYITIDGNEFTSESRISNANPADNKIDRQTILGLLDNNSLTTHFQPIFSSKDGTVYGYEALTRIKGDNSRINIGDLFKKAILTNTISPLDVKCRENAISLASSLGINHGS
ncbi:MAG: EAL domain-containing protein, partial [Bacteroidetes bacterium]|nr:EAL domain-containing protein [Bacteroidota bacterium]